MLSKNFKSDKYYEVTRYWLKHGNEEDGLENTITVWDSLEKAKAYIERYNKGLKFESATVEEIIVNKVITMEDYKKNNFEIVSYQEVYKIFQVNEGTAWCIEANTLAEAKEIAKKYKGHIVIKKGLKIVAEFNNINDEKEYKIYFGDDRTFGIQTIGLRSALELGQAYAKDHAGEKIVIIDEDKNTVKEFFEEKKEPVKNSIRTATNFKPRYLSKKEYDDAYQSFSSLVRVGDMVDEQIVEEFRDCIPPVAYNGRYLQCGEAYTHKFNYKTQKYEPAFMTFAKDVGVWVYKGICFYREYEDVG